MAGATDKDAHPEYWREYSNLQRTKHELIKCYLNGWLPKLGSWAGRILYLDTHAGRGRHESGNFGSPLIALRTVLEHKHRNTVFGDCEIVFFFVERDQENASALEQEIAGLGVLPNQVQTIVLVDECYRALSSLLDDLKKSRGKLAPAFVFVDPYGFKVPGNLLRELMGFERVELFINVIWRELSMAIAQGDLNAGLAETLKTVFDGDDWRELIGLEFESQAGACVDLLRSKIGARWATHIRMLGNNYATRYMLMHLTNHDAGRDQMKDCMWKVSPVHPFIARASDDPSQQFLIEPEPDLAPLRQWLLKRLSCHPWRWQDLNEEVRNEVWRSVHLNKVIRQLRKENIIDYRGSEKFTQSQNPELYLVIQK